MGLGSKIKNIFWPSGIPVYLEEEGTILGYVVGKEGEDESKIYKIKCDIGVVDVPEDSVIVTKKALIYRPSWSNEVNEFIKNLENEKNINPDLELALSGGNIENERIKEIIEKGRVYKKLIEERYRGFKEMRDKNIREMQYLMQKRMANAIDKGEYVKEMNELRKKIKILELNIKEAEKILAKLDYPVFTTPKVENVKSVAVPVPVSSEANVNPNMNNMEAPAIDRKRVKKLRVLKVEADLIALQSKLKNKQVISPEDVSLEIRKIDEELGEIDKILKTDVSPSVREYFEKRRDQLLRRREELKKEVAVEKKEETTKNIGEEKLEEISESSPPKEGESVEDLDKLIKEITNE